MALSEQNSSLPHPFTIFSDGTALPTLNMPTNSKKHKEEEFSLIPREKLLKLYTDLLRCRMLEERVAGNVSVRRSPSRTSCAAAVATCADLRPGDMLASPARDLLPAFMQGRSLAMILSSLHISTAVQRSRFAGQLRAALSTARRNRANGNRKIVIIFGRPATGRQWQTMLRVANNERLPIIFVCKGQSHRRSLRPPRYLPAISVDRDDVVALYRVASEGIAHARRGNGPTLIECIPWHPAATRKPADAVAKLETYMMSKGISPSRRKTSVTAEFETELSRRRRLLQK